MDGRSSADGGRPPGQPLRVRRATPDDADALAACVDLASHGLARTFWAAAAEPGEDLLAVGARRARRDEGAFSWRNAMVAAFGGTVAGGLVAYRIGPVPEPVEEAPPIVQPLVALENAAPGTWYVNVLATLPGFRRLGVARALLEQAAVDAGGTTLSLVVADDNREARALYDAFGFVEAARRPVVRDGWETASRDWVLMLRPAR